MSSVNAPEAVSRMKSEDRRELILEAATAVFGEFGYVGATTDQVARAAGVSQPYVVRMFGSKEKLFLEVLNRAHTRLVDTFRAVLAEPESDVPLRTRFGRAYVDLLADRGLLLSLMQAFVLGSDRTIGAEARRGFLGMYAFLRDEAGFPPEEISNFLAGGMLINTLVGMRMSDEFESNPLAHELLTTALPEKLDCLLEVGRATEGNAK